MTEPTALTPVDWLRRYLGESIPAGMSDTDTAFTDIELSNMLDNNGGLVFLAASRGWTMKAAEKAEMIDVDESGSARSLSQLFKQATSMANFFQEQHVTYELALIDTRIVGKSIAIKGNDKFVPCVDGPFFELYDIVYRSMPMGGINPSNNRW